MARARSGAAFGPGRLAALAVAGHRWAADARRYPRRRRSLLARRGETGARISGARAIRAAAGVARESTRALAPGPGRSARFGALLDAGPRDAAGVPCHRGWRPQCRCRAEPRA